jgi:hypothetical protein
MNVRLFRFASLGGGSSVGIGDGVIYSAVRVLSLRWGVITKHSFDEKILKLN